MNNPIHWMSQRFQIFFILRAGSKNESETCSINNGAVFVVANKSAAFLWLHSFIWRIRFIFAARKSPVFITRSFNHFRINSFVRSAGGWLRCGGDQAQCHPFEPQRLRPILLLLVGITPHCVIPFYPFSFAGMQTELRRIYHGTWKNNFLLYFSFRRKKKFQVSLKFLYRQRSSRCRRLVYEACGVTLILCIIFWDSREWVLR